MSYRIFFVLTIFSFLSASREEIRSWGFRRCPPKIDSVSRILKKIASNKLWEMKNRRFGREKSDFMLERNGLFINYETAKVWLLGATKYLLTQGLWDNLYWHYECSQKTVFKAFWITYSCLNLVTKLAGSRATRAKNNQLFMFIYIYALCNLYDIIYCIQNCVIMGI